MVAALSIILIFCPFRLWAYDNDTHYWLTFYLAVKAGFTNIQAEQIASADVSVDFDADTEPVSPDISILDVGKFQSKFSEIRVRFHALADKAAVSKAAGVTKVQWWDPRQEDDAKLQAIIREQVRARQDEFWNQTLAAGQNPGTFLHYLQDTYSHRNFLSFFGHAGYKRVDHLSSVPLKSREMVEMTLRYLVAYKLFFSGGVVTPTVKSPSEIDLIKYLTKSDLAAIHSVLDKFIAANPSTGVVPNGVVTKWNELDDKYKDDFYTPSVRLVPSLVDAYKENTAPDSRRAREIVRTELKLSRLPEIWLYDYDRTGNALPLAVKARVYTAYATPIAPTPDFQAKKESANTKPLAVASADALTTYCMPFILTLAASVPPCPK